MLFQVIDPGSYSIKFVDFVYEKKQLNLVNFHEILISEIELEEERPLWQIQADAIIEYLGQSEINKRIILLVPHQFLTTRFLNLPVPVRKNAEKMIPFQLEENLPYPLPQTHYIKYLSKRAKEHDALICLTKSDEFAHLYNTLAAKDSLPAVMTAEVFPLNTYASTYHFSTKDEAGKFGPKGSYAIVDIGHQTSKGYFITQGQLVSNHISYTGGKIVEEIIAKNYDIPLKDAAKYKKENAFFLTDEQYSEVDETQAEFAKIMKQAIWPLVVDLQRWELGFRVKYGHTIDAIYITGGTSNIKNIQNFLTKVLGIKVVPLNFLDQVKYDPTQISDDQLPRTQLAQLTAMANISKNPLPSFLTGKFASKFNEGPTYHGAAFIAARTMIVGIIFALVFSVENWFLGKDLRFLDASIMTQLKSPALGLNRSQRHAFRRNPKHILADLRKKNRTMRDEVKSMMSSVDTDGLKGLVGLSKVLTRNLKVNLIYFEGDDEYTKARFSSEDINELKDLKNRIDTSGLSVQLSELDEKTKTLSVEISEG